MRETREKMRPAGKGRVAGIVRTTVSLAVFWIVAVAAVPAQEVYTFQGTARAEYGASWYSDTYALLQGTTGVDRYVPEAGFEIDATHRVSFHDGDFVLDHALLATPASASDDAANGRVSVLYELYRAELTLIPIPMIEFGFGRQRYAGETGLTFSSTDAFHPYNAETDVGFDGFSVTFRPGSDLAVGVAAALQEIVATGDLRDFRTAGSVSWYGKVLEAEAIVAYQPEEILRPGMLVSVPLGSVRIVSETAVEFYAEEAVINPRLLTNAAIEYRRSTGMADVILEGEYRFSGLADDTLPSGGRTRLFDNAGGFDVTDFHYARFEASATSAGETRTWSTTHTAMVNLADGSAVLNHEFVCSRFVPVDLGFSFSWTGGSGNTEFGVLPYHAWGSVWVEVHL